MTEFHSMSVSVLTDLFCQKTSLLVSWTICKLLKTLFDLSGMILGQVCYFEERWQSTRRLLSIIERHRSVGGSFIRLPNSLHYSVMNWIVSYGGFGDLMLVWSTSDPLQHWYGILGSDWAIHAVDC